MIFNPYVEHKIVSEFSTV